MVRCPVCARTARPEHLRPPWDAERTRAATPERACEIHPPVRRAELATRGCGRNSPAPALRSRSASGRPDGSGRHRRTGRQATTAYPASGSPVMPSGRRSLPSLRSTGFNRCGAPVGYGVAPRTHPGGGQPGSGHRWARGCCCAAGTSPGCGGQHHRTRLPDPLRPGPRRAAACQEEAVTREQRRMAV